MARAAVSMTLDYKIVHELIMLSGSTGKSKSQLINEILADHFKVELWKRKKKEKPVRIEVKSYFGELNE